MIVIIIGVLLFIIISFFIKKEVDLAKQEYIIKFNKEQRSKIKKTIYTPKINIFDEID